MREVKNFEACESKEVLESIGSGIYTLITGERGMFLINKTMEKKFLLYNLKIISK